MIEVTPKLKKYWTDRYSMEEIIEMASAFALPEDSEIEDKNDEIVRVSGIAKVSVQRRAMRDIQNRAVKRNT